MIHPTTDRERAIRECMTRLSKRSEEALRAAMFCVGGSRLPRPHVRQQLRKWFSARMSYLEAEYCKAINEADNIIGKQWLYDQRPKLPE